MRSLLWDVVRTLALNRRGRSEGNPPALPSSDGGPPRMGTDATEGNGGSGPGVLGGTPCWTGRYPGPRRRRLNFNGKASQ